jgi:hypothetical protein
MPVPRTVADLLRDHVTLEVEGIDRMYLNVYVPDLQREQGVVWFLRHHRGHLFASSALLDPISKAFLAAIDAFVQHNDIPLVSFVKGQRKDDVAAEYRAAFTGREGVLFVGRAQEKTPVFRTEKRTNPRTGKKYPWIVRSTALVNHFYFYCIDEDFGPFFLKFCTYFPYNAKLCINGHEYVKRQLAKEGIAFEALDNGILSCADPRRLQEICDGLSAGKIDGLLRKWLARLPHPFTPQDRAAGYRYDVSILQAEFSLTQILDRPLTGRIFFEEVIRENLDIGRPDRVQLIFNRAIVKKTPGRFRTRVLTDGVTPSLHIDYKGSRIKQYHKKGRALRTETTIHNSLDFKIGKRLSSQPASAGRPTHQPRLRDRRGRLPRGDQPGGGGRSAGVGAALRRSVRPGVVRRAAGFPPAASGLLEPRVAGAPGEPPLRGDALRVSDRALFHPQLRTDPAAWAGGVVGPGNATGHRAASRRGAV